MSDALVTRLAGEVARACLARGVMLAVAESCTGGGIAEACTRIPGSSAWFERGMVTYTNVAKEEMLGVSARTLHDHGAVSEEVAREMAAGALARSHARVSVAVTGIAGPTGATPGKPVGTVHFAWAVRGGEIQSRRFLFKGGRDSVRSQSVAVALQGLVELVSATK